MADSTHSTAQSQTSKILGDSIAYGMMFALALTVIQRIVGFGRGLLFCRLMPEEQLGQWSLVYSFVLMLAPLAMLGLPGSFCRYVEHYRQSGHLGSFLVQISKVCFGAAIIFSGLMFLWPEPLGRLLFRGADTLVVQSMSLAILSTVVFFYLTSLLESLCQVRLVSLMRFMMAISFAIFSLTLVVIWKNGVVAVTIGYTASNLLGALPGIWFVVIHRRQMFYNTVEQDRSVDAAQGAMSIWRKVVPFAAWLWLANFVTNVYEVADRSMLLHFSHGTDHEAQALVGQYHSGRVLPLVLVGIAVVIGGFFMPYMTRKWENQQQDVAREQLRWATKLVGLGFTIAAFVMLLLAPLMFDTILGGRYADGYSVLPITLVYCIWYSILIVVVDYLWVLEKGKLAVAIVTIGLIVNVAVNYFTIPVYGLMGAVFATALSNLVALVLVLLFNQKLGLPVDRHIWLVVAVPLVLLMPLLYAAISLLLIAVAAIRFHWLIDDCEKQKVIAFLETFFQKLRRKSAAH